jgi:antitoxin MazE
MRTSVAKWGNSLAVRLPKEVAEAAGLREGAALDLAVEGGVVTLSRRRWDIRELVAGIQGAPPNLELEDEARGDEVW